MMTNHAHPTRFLLRPCQDRDLAAMERFAAASPVGITTLPFDRAFLSDRLQRSQHSFQTEDASGEEIYLFALEDLATQTVIGISGIAARAGFADRFYSFRNEFVVHRSPALGVTNRIHTLHLCHDLTDVTLLISFHVEPDYAETLAPQLLSRARLLFIADQRERFADRVAAESPGLADDDGHCPVWDAVGRRFFGMDYPTIERLTGGRSKSFIADLMPASPIYVQLLPAEAQFAIGQLHPIAELPFSILIDEGFDADTYLDIFDGGPIAHERLAMLKSVARLCLRRAVVGSVQSGQWCLLSNGQREQFRAVIAYVELTADMLITDAETLQHLGLNSGERVQVSVLDREQEAGR